jgi:hypothetical protein
MSIVRPKGIAKVAGQTAPCHYDNIEAHALSRQLRLLGQIKRGRPRDAGLLAGPDGLHGQAFLAARLHFDEADKPAGRARNKIDFDSP